mgnify:CR=1 FL=1
MTVQLIFLGLEDASVNTQAAILAKQLRLPHISMQKLLSQSLWNSFRSDFRSTHSSLIPTTSDTGMLAMLKARFREPDAYQGWILTGFPTCLAHAQSLYLLLEYMGRSQPQALYLSLDRQVLLERLALDTTDTAFSATQRLQENQKRLAPVIEYYQELKRLTMADGNSTTQSINEKILDALKKRS